MTTPRSEPTSINGSREQAAGDIDAFASDLERFRAGKVPDAVFLENRLRYGVYGQRQDGVHMVRTKIPLGLLGAAQLEAFADIAEHFGSGVAHLTTRQDIQVHFVPLEGTPALMHLLNEQGVTSREACGNVVRNVTASPFVGVTPDEPFDVTPYGIELARFLLRHPDTQNMGRKVKITLAGSDDPNHNLSALHDVGLTARIRAGERGFRVLVGGGLGPVPHEAQLYAEFVPAADVPSLCQAILRVFSERGEKQNRARARLKFLVAKMGLASFREEVQRVLALLPDDPARKAHFSDAAQRDYDEQPLHAPGATAPIATSEREALWLRTNTVPQRQPGYAAVAIRVPRGDLSPGQLRGLAALLRRHTGDTLRIGLEQSLVLRWVPSDRLLSVRRDLAELELAQERAASLGDTLTCPGADSCKLGITRPRSVARAMQQTLDRLAQHRRLEKLRIHVSGCPNACAQHHIADIGLQGAARTVHGVSSPHYILFLGGMRGGVSKAQANGGQAPLGQGFGQALLKVPAHRTHEAIEHLLELYKQEGLGSDEDPEPFGAFVRRIGTARIRRLLRVFGDLPRPSEAPSAYREPGSEETFVVVRGVGECAGTVVEAADLLLKDADRELELAGERLDQGGAGSTVAAPAKAAMLLAARSLLSAEGVQRDDPTQVEHEFRRRFYDTGRIFEGIGYYFLESCAEAAGAVAGDRTRRLLVEASLFVDEAHSMLARLRGMSASAAPPAQAAQTAPSVAL
ncbi:MAG: nitrite/sulfite reductase [Proteobacteria bacterium]|nr:nitrite/sulfite reductase [Pseudomonadota bacterium]